MNRINRRYMVWPVCVLCLVTVTMIGLVPPDYMLDAFPVSIIPIAFSAVILMLDKDYRPFADRKNLLPAVILSGLFIFMLSLEEIARMLLKMDGRIFNRFFLVLYPVVLIFSVLTDVDYILCRAMDSSRDKNEEEADMQAAYCSRCFGIYPPVWLLVPILYVFALGYFPGIPNSDMDIEWIGGGHPAWSDWHTVGFAFFVRLCTLIIHRPFMVTIIQMLMYILTVNYAVGCLYRYFPNKRNIGYIFIILYAVCCSYCCMFISDMVKDNCCNPMLLAFSVSMFDYVMSREHSKRQYINIIVLGFLASIFRHMMIITVLLPVDCVAISHFLDSTLEKSVRRKLGLRMAGTGVTIIVMFWLLTEVFAFGILGAERNPAYVKYSIPMNLVGSMAFRSSVTDLHIDDEIVDMMEDITPFEVWVEHYSPHDTDPLCRAWNGIGEDVFKLNDPETAANIIRIDWYYLTHYPRECLISYFDITSMVWEISKPPELNMYSLDPGEAEGLRRGSFYTFCDSAHSFFASFAIGRTLVYRGGLYLYMLVVISVILIRKRRINEWLTMLPILIYALLLMLSIPQPLSRYTMGFSMYAVLFGIVAYYLPRKGGEEQ